MNIFFTDDYGKPEIGIANTLDDAEADCRFFPQGGDAAPEVYFPAVEYIAIGFVAESFAANNVSICFKRREDAAEAIVHLSADLVLALAEQIKSHR